MANKCDKCERLIVSTNAYSEEVLDILRSCIPEGFILLAAGKYADKEFSEAIAQADYLLVGGRRKIDRNLLCKAKHLKMIQRTGVGLDSLDLDYIAQNNIPLYVNSGVNAESVAEHTLLLTLAALRKLTYENYRVKQGFWDKHSIGIHTHELFGKTVGIVGMGNIGRTFRRLLQPFNVSVLYYDRMRLLYEDEKELEVSYLSLDDLVQKCDVVSLHCPLMPETTKLLGKEQFNRMKQDAVIINTARGGLVDEAALYDALASGKIGAAGLDVFTTEPPQSNSPLLKLDNVISTPHIAGITQESYSGMINRAMNNIKCFEQGDFEPISDSKWEAR